MVPDRLRGNITVQTLIVGDIHGCYKEFRNLLDKAGLNDEDRVIALGDLVNRGPKSERVLAFFQKNQDRFSSIMGNHEYRHICAYSGVQRPNTSTLYTRWQLGESYPEAIAYMQSLPPYIELEDVVLVHGYYQPGVPLDKQDPNVLIGGPGVKGDLGSEYDQPWYTYYEGEKPLIVGHRDWSGVMKVFNYKDRVFGIDTRCVYGGALTGLLLPSWQFVSVPAKRDHFARFRKRYVIDAD
jgi:serine/threonine protein phosphatase 1